MLKIELGKENKILRNMSEPVKTHELQKYVKLGREMLKYIKDPEHAGVGLAAPQVGINKRLIIVSLLSDWEDEGFSTVMMINPQVLEHSKQTNKDNEGCLSLPKTRGEVMRWNDIKLTYLDEKGKTKTLKFQGLSARIIQHEIDHLDGILFTDKLVK